MRYVVDIYEIKKHPSPLPTCGQVADTLRRVFVPLAVECPDGVAYMPVPRCETCAHWTPHPPNAYPQPSGSCAVLKFESPVGLRLFTTAPDFGCVKHEEK